MDRVNRETDLIEDPVSGIQGLAGISNSGNAEKELFF
jgi:hypothetical protein